MAKQTKKSTQQFIEETKANIRIIEEILHQIKYLEFPDRNRN